MSRPVLLLDVDGPLAAFTAAYLRALQKETGVLLSVDDVDQLEIHKTPSFRRVAAEHTEDRDVAELKRRVDARVTRPGFCSAIEVQPDAYEAAAKLGEVADVYVVTSPWNSCPTWTHEREAWLWDHFGIPSKRVIHTSAKARVHGDLLLDDNAEHVRNWTRQWPAGVGVLHALPSNRNDGEGLTRGGWDEVVAEVTRRTA